MTVSDLDILRAAHLHLERYGDQAVAKAREMVRTLKARGDNDGADTWLRIIVAIETMRQEPSGPDPAPNRGLISTLAVHPGGLNAWFAPYCRRSDARGLTSQIDPQAPLVAIDQEGRSCPRLCENAES